MSILTSAEQRYPVDSWNIDGIAVWPIIRIHLGLSLYHEGAASLPAPSHSRLASILSTLAQPLRSFLDSVWTVVRDARHSTIRLKHADVVLYTTNLDRVAVDGSLYNKLCDPLATVLGDAGFSSITLEGIHDRHTQIPRSSASKIFQTELDWLQLWYAVRCKIQKKHTVTMARYEEFEKELHAAGHGASLQPLTTLVERTYTIRMYASHFSRMLKKVSPTMVVTTEYYNDISMAFNLACRERGIISADLQHGGQGAYHHAYGSWNRVPKEGYALLPSLFLNWSESDSTIINEWASQSNVHRAIPIGNLWLDMWKNGFSGSRAQQATLQKYMRTLPQKRHILFTLQNEMPDERIFSLARKTSNEWYWWIRVHPCQLQMKELLAKKISSAGMHNANIELATSLPLPLLLAQMDVHLTKSSGCILEAEYYGIPSIALDREGIELFPDQAQRESVTLCPSYDALTSCIADVYKQRLAAQHPFRSGVSLQPLLQQLRDKEQRP